MATSEPGRQTTYVLPHFEYEVPLLVGSDGLHYVPTFVVCRLLGLDAARELRRAGHVLLWDMARLLHVQWSGKTYFAWCLPYPLGIGYWLGTVERHCIQDPERRAQLDRAVKDSIALGGQAWRLASDRFEQGRKRMYVLSQHMTEVGDALRHLQQHAPWPSPDTQRRIDWLAIRQQALADQVQAFVQAWFADKAGLPVVDTIHIDKAGNVLDEGAPTRLFGILSEEEDAELSDYEQAITTLVADLNRVLRGLDSEE